MCRRKCEGLQFLPHDDCSPGTLTCNNQGTGSNAEGHKIAKSRGRISLGSCIPQIICLIYSGRQNWNKWDRWHQWGWWATRRTSRRTIGEWRR